jgi:hypothetical protein
VICGGYAILAAETVEAREASTTTAEKRSRLRAGTRVERAEPLHRRHDVVVEEE